MKSVYESTVYIFIVKKLHFIIIIINIINIIIIITIIIFIIIFGLGDAIIERSIFWITTHSA